MIIVICMILFAKLFTPPDTWFGLIWDAYVILVDTNSFPELEVIFPDYALRASLSTFLIMLIEMCSEHPHIYFAKNIA